MPRRIYVKIKLQMVNYAKDSYDRDRSRLS
jgi:hypothetical protein